MQHTSTSKAKICLKVKANVQDRIQRQKWLKQSSFVLYCYIKAILFSTAIIHLYIANMELCKSFVSLVYRIFYHKHSVVGLCGVFAVAFHYVSASYWYALFYSNVVQFLLFRFGLILFLLLCFCCNSHMLVSALSVHDLLPSWSGHVLCVSRSRHVLRVWLSRSVLHVSIVVADLVL